MTQPNFYNDLLEALRSVTSLVRNRNFESSYYNRMKYSAAAMI